MCPGPFKLNVYKVYIVLWVAQVIDYMRLIMIYCLHGSGTRVCCANVTDTGVCVNFTYSGNHTIRHSISTVHWLEWPPPMQSRISAKLWVWWSLYDQQGNALWHWASLGCASPTCTLDDATRIGVLCDGLLSSPAVAPPCSKNALNA